MICFRRATGLFQSVVPSWARPVSRRQTHFEKLLQFLTMRKLNPSSKRRIQSPLLNLRDAGRDVRGDDGLFDCWFGHPCLDFRESISSVVYRQAGPLERRLRAFDFEWLRAFFKHLLLPNQKHGGQSHQIIRAIKLGSRPEVLDEHTQLYVVQ